MHPATGAILGLSPFELGEINRQIRESYNGSEELFQEELKRARMSREAYRKMTKDQLIVEAMRAEKISEAPPPLPGEIQKEYNEIKDTIRDITKDKITFNKIFLPRQDAENPLATPESQKYVSRLRRRWPPTVSGPGRALGRRGELGI